MKEKKILTEVKTWITEYLEIPNENFGGMPVCPFVKAEREKNKLKYTCNVLAGNDLDSKHT